MITSIKTTLHGLVLAVCYSIFWTSFKTKMPLACLRHLSRVISPNNASKSSCTEDVSMTCYLVANYVLFTMILLSFFYGVISWIAVKSFRNFNNYVFMNAILVNIFRFICTSIVISNCELTDAFIISFFSFKNIAFNIFLYFTTVYNFWVIVICYGLYVKVVKVFYIEVESKCIKSFLYAWGVPLTVLVICKLVLLIIQACIEEESTYENVRVYYIYSCVMITCCIIPSGINLTIFIKVVRALYSMKDPNSAVTKRQRRIEKLRRLSTIVLMFFLSNVYVLTFLIWDVLDLTVVIRVSTVAIQIITSSLMFPLLKRNRNVWCEYFKKRWSKDETYTVRS